MSSSPTPLYIIERLDTSPYFKVVRVQPYDQEARAAMLQTRNPACQSLEEARSRIRIALKTKFQAAQELADKYQWALDEFDSQSCDHSVLDNQSTADPTRERMSCA